jgi:hypothetical protein
MLNDGQFTYTSFSFATPIWTCSPPPHSLPLSPAAFVVASVTAALYCANQALSDMLAAMPPP